MPETIPQLLYILMGSVIAIALAVIAFFIKKGFADNGSRLSSIDGKLDEVATELRVEREQRIISLGKIEAEFLAHKTLCEERHRK